MSVRFHIDYDIGWIGFTNVGGAVTNGIDFFERWERPAGTAAVSHAFICAGPNQGIEAHLETGVALFDLRKYSEDSNCRLYFKRPSGWTIDLGRRIAATACHSPPFGCKYDTNLIVADALCDTVTGRLLNRASCGLFKNVICRILGRSDRFICSETVAFVLQKQPELALRGCLQNPADTIDPQQLYCDSILFPG